MSSQSRELRSVLGRFATGVCVITTTRADSSAVGITANSFSSVSLEPPLVLWNLQNDSERYADFCSPRYFAINVLSSDQEPLSAHYASRGVHHMDTAHFASGQYGSPIVHGALASLECETETTYEAGDHLIIIGRVRSMVSGEAAEPLLFYGGAYRKLEGLA